jgi:hypothetical protein
MALVPGSTSRDRVGAERDSRGASSGVVFGVRVSGTLPQRGSLCPPKTPLLHEFYTSPLLPLYAAAGIVDEYYFGVLLF